MPQLENAVNVYILVCLASIGCDVTIVDPTCHS
jgi:hypothetical protein